MPHRKSHVLADVAKGGAEHVQQAIDAATKAHADWSRMPWHERAAIFLRAAELLSGPWRSTLNAATMLNQSKTAHQAEIDAVCEMIDFWRYNVDFLAPRLLRAAALADRDLEPPGVPAARGLRLRGQPVQLQLHRREPLLDAGAHGLHGRSGSPRRRPRSRPTTTCGSCRRPGLPDGVINLVYGSGATIGSAARREPRARGHPLHRLDRGLQRHVGDRRRERRRREVPRLPAPRRRDGREGLHPRAPLRRGRGGRDRGRPRLVRVPGPEVLGGLAALRPVEPLAGGEGASSSPT